MSEILCLSYVPFLLITHNNTQIFTMSGNFQIPSFLQIKSYTTSGNVSVRKIVFKSNFEFFVFSHGRIFTYFVDKDNLILRDTIDLKNVSLREGFYNSENNILYGISMNSVYFIDVVQNKIVCTFPNVLSMLINEKRFYQCTPKGFFHMLLSENISVFETKHRLRAIIRHLYGILNMLRIECHGFFQNYYVLTTLKQIIFVNRLNIFNQKIYSIEHFPTNRQILIQKRLWLITFEKKLFEIVLRFYTFAPGPEYLFQHQIFFQNPHQVTYFEVCLIDNFVYILLQVKHQTPKFYYLFDIREKYLSELIQLRIDENRLHRQLQSFDNFFREEESFTVDTESRVLGKCCVCYENNVSVVFFPCAHICSCSKCCDSLDSCPLCRKQIKYKKQTFLLTN